MKIENLFESEQGIYVGVRFSDETKEHLLKVIEKFNIPNPVATDDFHATIIYSKKSPTTQLKVLGSLEEPETAKATKFHIFTTRDEKNALVIKLDSDFLKNRHKTLMREYELSYDFDEYIPHVTVSYDCGEFDIKNIDTNDIIEDLEIVLEYKENLNTKKFSKE